MEFYHNLVTQQSWEELKNLKKVVGNFVLIGGWAVYLYTKALKSKDIDIIINYDQLPSFEKHYQFYKNDRLKKYEAVKGNVQIDIYLPHYSEIGIPVENLLRETSKVGGFSVLNANYLFVLKLVTLKARGRSPKGSKDLIDLVSLYNSGVISSNIVRKITKEYNLYESLDRFKEFLSENTEISELALNKHSFSKLQKKMQVDLFE